MDNGDPFEGPLSTPQGMYSGGDPELETLVQDDGSWEAFYVVDFTYYGNKWAVEFDDVQNTRQVYAVDMMTNGTDSIGIGVAPVNFQGFPDPEVAGPYYIVPPGTLEYFTFHFPELDQPLTNGNFFVTLSYTPNSPGSPGIGVDVNGTQYVSSYYYSSNNGGWNSFPGGNIMVRPSVGIPSEGSESDVPAKPYTFSLGAAYPNPFNPTVAIPFELPKNGEMKLQVFNLMGQEVSTLVSGAQRAGHHVAIWDGKSAGLPVASGAYIVRLQAGDKVAVRKVTMVK
jgi:hypothetical protein